MKDVPGYEGLYAVDDAGNVYSFKWGNFRKLRPGLNNRGYYMVVFYKNKIKQTHEVHRLVAMTFLEDFLNDLHVDHIDGNKQNNHISNLRMVTHQQNSFNRPTAKGYYWNKPAKKWMAKICLNYKTKYLGYFDTEAEARDAYLAAKKIYHII
jgi:vacuolar-type H+-ATPase catalytic subunit A/Vma1